MEESSAGLKQPPLSDAGAVTPRRRLAATAKRLVRRLLAIGENRLELLTVEMQEERQRLLQAVVMALGVAALGLLAGIAFTGLVVVLLWDRSPVATLLGLTGFYGAAAIGLYWRLNGRLRDWHTLSASLEQLRKDRACLEKLLE